MWGRRRLMAFARTLPIAETLRRAAARHRPAERVDRAARRDAADARAVGVDHERLGARQLARPVLRRFRRRSAATIDRLARTSRVVRRATLAELVAVTRTRTSRVVLGSLHELAKRGQLAYDFATGVYRWRPILDVALSDAMLGPEPEESRRGQARSSADVTITRTERRRSASSSSSRKVRKTRRARRCSTSTA